MTVLHQCFPRIFNSEAQIINVTKLCDITDKHYFKKLVQNKKNNDQF